MDRQEFEEASNRRGSTLAGLLAIWSIGVLDATWPKTSITGAEVPGRVFGARVLFWPLVLAEIATAVAGSRRPSSRTSSTSPHTCAVIALRCRR